MGKRIAVYSTAWNAELIGGILHGMSSIGYILTFEGEEELEMDDYIKQADNMMYKIKQEKKKGRQ